MSEKEAEGERGGKFCSSSNVVYFILAYAGVSCTVSCWAQQWMFMLHLSIAGPVVLCSTGCFLLYLQAWEQLVSKPLSIPCVLSKFDICREVLGVGCCLSQQGLLCRELWQ